MKNFVCKGSMLEAKDEKMMLTTINEIAKGRDAVSRHLRMIYGTGLAFNLVKSSLFHEAINSIANHGKELIPIMRRKSLSW